MTVGLPLRPSVPLLVIIEIFRDKSGFSLGAISKYLKVPRTSLQMMLHKYKHQRSTHPSHNLGRCHVLIPGDERMLVLKAFHDNS